MEQIPKILHLSARESSSKSEFKWLKVNIVFKVFEEHDIATCDSESSEYVTQTLWEVDDPEMITNHFMHTRIKWSEADEKGYKWIEDWITDPKYDISSKKRKGWQSNPRQMLTKIDKFNVYRYHDYVEDNSITRGALALLEQIKDGHDSSSRFAIFSTLIRCIRVLDTFWD